MCIKRALAFVAILITFMVGIGSNIGIMVDAPSLIIVLGGTISALLFSGRSIIGAFKPLFSCKGRRSGDDETLWRASETWRDAESYFVGSGIMGLLIGCVIMLANVDDPAAIGPGMAIAILTVLYAVFFKYFICKPISVYLGIKADAAFENSEDNETENENETDGDKRG
tara:strand:+ start:1900 stop:2406 length:507 start_codon:yes stop_codon:yes gene_type:complete